MTQIINLNIGKAGIKIGQHFIKQIANQHFHHNQQHKGKPQTFFHQTQQHSFIPRSLFLDIDPNPINQLNLKTQHYSIPKSNIFKGTGLNCDIFPTGKYLQGAAIVNQSINQVRKQVQKCDRLSGFLIINSIGGGTGSGMTTQMLLKLKQIYSSSIVQQHFVLPQIQNICSPLHIYNTVFSISHCVEFSDICILAENSAFIKKLFVQGNMRPTLNDINKTQAEMIKQITAPYRFRGTLNTNQRKTCTNLMPFPRIKFIVSSCSDNKQKYDYLNNAFNIINYSKTDFFKNPTITKSQLFTMQVNCRDNFAYESQIDKKVNMWRQQQGIQFSDWTGKNVHLSISQKGSTYPSASVLFNSRHMKTIFDKWSSILAIMLRKKAFMYHYLGSGMDEMQFTEAQSNLNDLVCQYTPYNNFPDDDQLYDNQDPQ